MPTTLAEALKPFLLPEMPSGAAVGDAGQGVEVRLQTEEGARRWFRRNATRRYRFTFSPEVLEPLLACVADSARISDLEHMAYLEHMAAVMGHAVEQWGRGPDTGDVSLAVGMTVDGDLDVKAVPDA